MNSLRPIPIILALLCAAGFAGTSAIPGRWSPEEANEWYRKQPWRIGCNFIPSSAINPLEMWQADTFDPETIDRELGWAAAMGMNSVRVYLHDMLWQQDSAAFLQRIDRFLVIADKHGIATMLVLCDAVWDPCPKPGRQPDPKPHVHNSGWVQSPHIDILRDPSRHASLEPYVRGVIGRFKDDRRVLVWDLYNEPGNNGSGDGINTAEKESFGLLLLGKLFTWARDIRPSQPLTSGMWIGEWIGPKASPINRFMRENSDVLSFHTYEPLTRAAERVGSLKPFGRPLLCTEYLARGHGSTFETHLPYLKENKVGAWNWGLVAGKTQTQYPWSSSKKQFTTEPEVWHHDILRPDGSPFRPAETERIRALARGSGS